MKSTPLSSAVACAGCQLTSRGYLASETVYPHSPAQSTPDCLSRKGSSFPARLRHSAVPTPQPQTKSTQMQRAAANRARGLPAASLCWPRGSLPPCPYLPKLFAWHATLGLRTDQKQLSLFESHHGPERRPLPRRLLETRTGFKTFGLSGSKRHPRGAQPTGQISCLEPHGNEKQLHESGFCQPRAQRRPFPLYRLSWHPHFAIRGRALPYASSGRNQPYFQRNEGKTRLGGGSSPGLPCIMLRYAVSAIA